MDDAFANSMVDRFRYLIDEIDSQYFTDFFRKQKIDEDLLKKVRRRIVLILKSVLLDNEPKQWFCHFGEVMLDLESLLDDAVAESCPVSFDAKSQNTNQAGSSISLGKGKDQYQQQMKSIAEKLEFIVKESTVGKDCLQLPATDCSNDEFEVIGRDVDKEAIIEKLLADDVSADQIDVIAITGTIGVGKTTVAQLIYDDKRVSDHFDLKLWFCVPEEFDVFRLTKTILEALVTSQPLDVEDLTSLTSLQTRLKEILNTKKYLLVLDNLGFVNHYSWETLLSNISAGTNGKIIVTTGISELAEMTGIVYVYHLEILTFLDRWILFAKHAAADKNSRLHPQLREIGLAIVKSKWYGWPLVAKVVGTALSFRPTVEEWAFVLKFSQRLSDLPDETSSILLALMPGYHYLPTNLKPCFAACEIFARGYEFEEMEVILLWMAKRLLPQPKHKSMEEIGHDYFRDLTSRCFFQRSSANRSCFIMHDLLHHLAHFVSGDAPSRLGHRQSLKVSRKATNIRHLSSPPVPISHTAITLLPVSVGALSNLETLTLSNCSSLRYLSYLDLSNCSSLTQLPTTIGKLIASFPHLELLDLSHCSITELPDSICNLETLTLSNCSSLTQLPTTMGKLIVSFSDLESLDLSHCSITELPDSICRLRKLRYLDLSHTAITKLPGSVGALSNLETLALSNCSSLTELPTTTGKLINLHHLLIDGTGLKQMPEDMGRLTNLQTLSSFIVGKYGGSSQIKELGPLSNLRGALQISELQNVVFATDASEASLKSKKKLHVLKLEWSNTNTKVDSQNETKVLEQLQPHKTLKELSIQFFNGTSFPHWLGDFYFSKMVLLRLSNCNNCSYLPPVGQLPSLEHLIVEEMNIVERVGPEFYGVNYSSVKPFQSLKILVFQGMSEWQEWISPEGIEFPCLQKICIQKCPKLKKRPFFQLPSTNIEVLECPELEVTPPRLPIIDDMQLHDADKEDFESNEKLVDRPLRTDDEFALQPSEDRTDDSITFQSSLGESFELFPENSSIKHEVSSSDSDSDSDDLIDISSPISMKVSEISQLEELPPRLRILKIEGCQAQKYQPQEVMRRGSHLQHLYIIDCCYLELFQGGHLFDALKSLYIRNCRKLDFLSLEETLRGHALLEHFSMGSSCDSLRCFPLTLFPKLRSLSIWDSANFDSISITENHMSLHAIEIRDCHELVYFPKEGLRTPNLTSILLSNCKNLKVLPDQLYSLMSLQSLWINDCPELDSIPKGGFPLNLDLLRITSCNKLTPCIGWGMLKLSNLSCFEIEGGCRDLESFPEQKLLPSNLNSLRISRVSNLKFLDYKGLEHQKSLETLEINCCDKLQSLPEEGLPSSLTSLYINECPSLKSKLQNGKGKEWYKIAHIPHIQIDDEVQ